MSDIHPTAIVDASASIADDVSIGPYSIVGAEVTLGAGVELMSHVVIGGDTTLGDGCRVFPFASLGLEPQDLKYSGERSKLVIGKNCTIREHVTMNPGTEGGGLLTSVGDDCLFMVGTHVAHDCQVGKSVIMANNAGLAGHVIVEEYAIIGGLAAIHQYVRIGRHAIVGGLSGVEQDVIPFGSVTGDRAYLQGLNLVGLKRHGFDRDDIHTLRNAYRLLFADEGTMSERMTDVDDVFGVCPPVEVILRFMQAESSRGVCQPKDGHAA
ncbi:MAG: acyl-ACP--UDP-N-acetylglucosamine O-acyltransferase [Alphaproteobacteria bacterium]|jgi:UDP-N-acetylglucosamine acyltransferase|nr:acyl-ACP--UDP-N-acetylglucosamine O-acyltransferase [Rhodospirillaceae bacterium]MDG2481118.1 acyl-ACP--UDP-N-acetylglucosamine O-acyltransferase [Alphaproteobacteria bacterium]